MKSKQQLRWEKTKAKGKLRFFLQTSLFFGLGVFLSAMSHKFLWKDDPKPDFWSILETFALAFMLPAVCAGLGALWYWEKNEKDFKNDSF